MAVPTYRLRRLVLAATAAVLCALTATALAQRGAMTPELAERRWAIEKELASIAVVERKVMLPMRDGVRLATDIYRPKDASVKVPTIFVRTPYNFNFWDVRNGVPGDMTAALTAVKRGYAYVVQNERGHFFSEGPLRHPRIARRRVRHARRGFRRSHGRTARSARPGARRRPSIRWAWPRWGTRRSPR